MHHYNKSSNIYILILKYKSIYKLSGINPLLAFRFEKTNREIRCPDRKRFAVNKERASPSMDRHWPSSNTIIDV